MSLFFRPWSTFDSLYNLISETRRRAKRRASSCFFASSLCAPPNAALRCSPAGGTYCVDGRSSACGGGGGGGTVAGRCVAVLVPNSSAAGTLKLGRAPAIISRIDAADIATVSAPPACSGAGGWGAAGGGGGETGAAASSADSLRLGDGIFLRIAVVSIRRPVVKTRISTDDASNFAASSSVTST